MAQSPLADETGFEEAVAEPVEPADDFLALANSAYEGSTTYLDANYRSQWERNLRQFRSQHNPGSKYLSEAWKGKSKFFRPKTRSAERKAEAGAAAALFSTADVIDIEPYHGRDQMQKASAAFWKEAMNYRLTKTVPWFVIAMGAYQDTQVMGAVVSHQCWDFERDRLKCEIRPLENIRIDPAADWADPISSSPYIIDILPMYVHEVRERSIPKAGSYDQPWFPVTEGQLTAAKAGSIDSTRLTRDGQRMDPKEGAGTGITDFDIVWVRRVILRWHGVDQIYYTLSDQALLTTPIDLHAAYTWLAKSMRPYVMGVSVLETHRIYPAGPVELTSQTQQELNELVNQRRTNVELVLNKRFKAKRHKQVDLRSLTRNMPGSVTMVDDMDDVEAFEWNDVTASAYQEEDRLNLDHDDLTGTFSGSSVMSNRKLNETVGGMNKLSSDASLTGDLGLKTFIETWYEPVLNQLLLLEQTYETDMVVMAMAGDKAGLIQKFNIDMITDDLLRGQLTLSINVGMGSTNPVNAVERFMAGVNSLAVAFGPEVVAQRLDFDETAAELFGKLGYKDGSRFFLHGGDDPKVQSLLNQIDQLKGQLAQKRSPEVDAATAKHKQAQALKTMVEAFFGASQAAQIIASLPETAPVADSVLQSAGYQPPSPPGIDPNLPVGGGGQVVPLRKNTSPLEPAIPASPVAGVNQGFEGG